MHIDPTGTAAPAPARLPDPQRRTIDGKTFERTLQDLRRARDVNDIDGDGLISDAERLLSKLKELAKQLAVEALTNRGKFDPQRMTKALQSIDRLIGELTGRIQSGEPITREDLADISAEAASIYMWGTADPKDADGSDPADSPAIDGRVDWRTDRPGADPAKLHVIDRPAAVPSIQRVVWVPVANAITAGAATP
jgi:hypothetical protein